MADPQDSAALTIRLTRGEKTVRLSLGDLEVSVSMYMYILSHCKEEQHTRTICYHVHQ